jgi:hypothetical protein
VVSEAKTSIQANKKMNEIKQSFFNLLYSMSEQLKETMQESKKF